MKTTLMIAAVLTGGAASAYAQEIPATVQPPAQTVPAPAKPEAIQPEAVKLETAKPAVSSAQRIREVKLMESIFANAVRGGAEDLGRRMLAADPGSLISTGTARARGIALDGYGVVFDVDVPLMNMSVIWTRQRMAAQGYMDQITRLQDEIAHTSGEEQQRAKDALILLAAQLQVMLPPGDPMRTALGSTLATPVANSAQPAAGSVAAATVPDQPAPAAVPPLETRSTNELYTDAVKKALMDAMVDHSSALLLGDDEWLVVAARDNAGPSIPGGIDDRSGIILRVKGSDLSAFKENKLSRDEVLKKVEIREWR
jgi:hypothetical protein